MGKSVAVENRTRLHGDLVTVDGSAPQEVSGLPVRTRFDLLAIAESDLERFALATHLDFDAASAHHDNAVGFEAQMLGFAQLPRNTSLAFVQHVVDMRRDRQQTSLRLAHVL